MSESTRPRTATGIATPDTSRETIIGYDFNDGRNQPTSYWNKNHANSFRLADSLYLKFEKYYQQLDRVDAGLKNGPTWWNQAYLNEWTNRDLIEIISGNLELQPFQQTRASGYFLSQDLSLWGIRKELVGWAVCAYIVHSDETDIRRCHPLIKGENKADQFWDMAYALDFTSSERLSTFNKVKTDMETPGSKRANKD